uniref:Ubiquitin carboxyl-terminal hydrolase n=1 Tax=Heliothis virescens TaxID=7102 RepID=A0A2A4J070_HELVI
MSAVLTILKDIVYRWELTNLLWTQILLELAGGKSGPSGLRRSSERSDSLPEPRSDKQSSHTSGLNGLRNIGNTCFMNSVLQCLSNTRPLLEYLCDERYADDINTSLSCMKGALIKAFGIVIKELWRSGEKDAVVNTTALKSQVQRFAPRFMGYSQQDAQEFLRYLLEGLHEDVNRVTVKPKPILTEIDDNLSDSAKAQEAWNRYLRMEDSRVGDIFVGQLKSTLRCTHCNHDSVTFDPFWDLSLPIPSRTGNLKLQQCLSHFTREEEMDGDEKPTCSKCGVRRKCLKWFTVQKFPQVLVLHLKRFSPTERFRGKLNVLVEFPLSNLDMSPYAATRAAAPVYNLYAVSNHSGTTYSGHYTAYCKHPYNGEWHEYNDSRVTPISSRNVVSSEAYVLFYELSRHT